MLVKKPWSLSFIDQENVVITEKSGKLLTLSLIDKKISEIKHNLSVLEVGQGGLLDVLHDKGQIYISYSENRGDWKTSTSVAKGKFNQANIEFKNQRLVSGEPCVDLTVKKSKLKGVELSGEIIPNIIDEIPIISIAAAFADGDTIIRDAAELRVKESDRLQAVSEGFSVLGIKHENFEDGMNIQGSSNTLLIDRSVSIESYDDHRIAMSFLIAGLKCSQSITVRNCENIFTSFPNFIELISSIGYELEKQ